MKNYFYFIIFLIFLSCKDKSEKNNEIIFLKPVSEIKIKTKKNFEYKLNIIDSLIVNNSTKEIDLLINGVENFLGGENLNLKIHSENIILEPIQEFNNGLVYAKQLFISKNEITFYPNEMNIPKENLRIRTETYGGENLHKFNFIGGNGKIKFMKNSCNDSDFNQVILNYGNKNLVIKNILNASFFEYDIDKDGNTEQYLLGTRSCSKEIVILRIRDKK